VHRLSEGTSQGNQAKRKSPRPACDERSEKYDGYEVIKVTVDNGISTLMLNRPEVHNACVPETFRDLIRYFTTVKDDPEVSVIIVTGAGASFSSGGDLRSIHQRIHSQTLLDQLPERRGLPLVDCMLSLPQPTVAAINGHAIGWGLSFALWCDIGIVAEDALIGDPHIKLGRVPPSGALMFEYCIGTARAKRMLLTGELISGKQAAEWGLIAKAVPRSEVLREAREEAERLRSIPPLAMRWTKRLLNARIHREVHGMLELSSAWGALSMATEDSREAIDAWIEKRKPQFRGR
jgi:enoyl-CoA hydratase